MFHKAIDVEFKEGTVLEVTFWDGWVKSFDMARLFSEYPQFEALRDREVFLSGELAGNYGVIWNDELDISVDAIYEDGTSVGKRTIPGSFMVADALHFARADANLSQSQLAELSGIDQSDISKIERGMTNPTVSTLERLAKAMGMRLIISIEKE